MPPRPKAPRKNAKSVDQSSDALKIKLRGKDNAPLTMQEFLEGLLEASRQLKAHEAGYRIRYATIYLTMIDETGAPVRLNEGNEIAIYPYRSAADDYGV